MIQYLEDLKGRGAPPLTASERDELNRLRKEHGRKMSRMEPTKKSSSYTKPPIDSDDESEVSLLLLMAIGRGPSG